MIPEVSKILSYWVKFADYDPEQKCFSLGSQNYDWHNVGNTMKKLISEYDENGYLACLYLKYEFKYILKDFRLTFWDAITNVDTMRMYQTMYALLYSEDMDMIESKFKQLCDRLIGTAIQSSKLIGEVPIDTLLSHLDNVVENIHRCKAEILLKSNSSINIQHVYPQIKAFSTIAECMLALNTAKDNTIFLCYITSRESLDNYFTYIIKSNGNILSINDRIPEAYVGQHKNHRNGRWMEGKRYTIFPYASFVKWSGSDYKGYATKAETQTDVLSISELEEDDLINILISMVLIINKFNKFGISEDMDQIYTISLLPQNIDKTCTSLIVQNENSLIASTYDVLYDKINEISTADIVNASYDQYRFISKEDNIFIKLWSDGFKFEPKDILRYDTTLAIQDKDYIPDAEFLGSGDTMTHIIMQEGRTQLRRYIEERMYSAFTDFGGNEGLKSWWQAAIRRHVRNIILLCCVKYEECNGSDEDNRGNYITRSTTRNIRLQNNEYFMYNTSTLNTEAWWSDKSSHVCISVDDPHDIHALPANTWFTFMLQKDCNLQDILEGEELPDIIKGFSESSRHTHTNSILDLSDDIETLGCPFESDAVNQYNYKLKQQIARTENVSEFMADCTETYRNNRRDPFRFIFNIGFSKREFKKMLNGNSSINVKYNMTKQDILDYIQNYKKNTESN